MTCVWGKMMLFYIRMILRHITYHLIMDRRMILSFYNISRSDSSVLACSTPLEIK